MPDPGRYHQWCADGTRIERPPPGAAGPRGRLHRMSMEDPGTPPPAPLAGVRVVDLSRVLAGPLATMTLGDLGADVIKIERPGEGDDTRHWGPPFAGDDAAYFLSLNRNKRSVALDLKTPEGVETVRRLSADADVLIENFRPGLMADLGLGLDDLRRSNPRLVTCSLTAFGDEAPRGRLASRLRHHRAGALRTHERHG